MAPLTTERLPNAPAHPSSSTEETLPSFHPLPSIASTIWASLRSSVPLFFADILAVIVAWSLLQIGGALIGALPTAINLQPLLATLVSYPVSLLCLGLYPALLMHPAEEMKRILTACLLTFSGFTIALALSDGLTWKQVSFVLCFAGSLGVLGPLARAACRSSLKSARWWKRPLHVLGNEIEQRQLRRWLRKHGRYGCQAVPSSTATDLAIAVQPSGRTGHESLSYRRIWHVTMMKTEPSVTRVQRINLHCPVNIAIKRTLDLVIIQTLAPIIIPVAALVAVTVLITSPGPIFYSQRRLGKNGRAFMAWKFRTMHVNADQLLLEYFEKDTELRNEWERDHKLKHDPRITSVGRWLRKTSLDELPQLYSVLIGEMSLVGPRPIVVDEIPKYEDVYRDYCRVKPGLTGLWQVSGRNNTTYEERLGCDRYYVENWSAWLDVYLICRTLKTVVLCEGAY